MFDYINLSSHIREFFSIYFCVLLAVGYLFTACGGAGKLAYTKVFVYAHASARYPLFNSIHNIIPFHDNIP